MMLRLSRDMTDRYGKGFSHSNVIYMRKLYLAYPKSYIIIYTTFVSEGGK